jgi:hypothetical protein
MSESSFECEFAATVRSGSKRSSISEVLERSGSASSPNAVLGETRKPNSSRAMGNQDVWSV